MPANFRPILYADADGGRSCLDLSKVAAALNVWHIVTDALLLIVPIVMLWKVQMRLVVKLRVWIIGLVG